MSNTRRLRDKSEGTPTVIGNDSVIKGEFRGAAPVIVLGRVEGDCDLDSVLTIEKCGAWVGNASAASLVVNGRIEGNVVAKGKLEVGATGEIVGNISAGFLAIASGAVLQGDIKMTGDKDPVHFEEKRKAV